MDQQVSAHALSSEVRSCCLQNFNIHQPRLTIHTEMGTHGHTG